MRRTLLVVEDQGRLRAVQGEVRRMLSIVASEQAEQDALTVDLVGHAANGRSWRGGRILWGRTWDANPTR